MRFFLKTLIILLFVTVSCSNERIPKDDLSDIIGQIYLADGFTNTNYIFVQKADSLAIYEPIINKRGYSLDDFTSTIGYYINRPGKLKIIYEEAKEKLKKRQLILKRTIDEKDQLELFASQYKQMVAEPSLENSADSWKRAVRWLLYPQEDGKWIYKSKSDSSAYLWSPKIMGWWNKNFQKDTLSLYSNEKNSSTISLPSKRGANSQRLPVN